MNSRQITTADNLIIWNFTPLSWLLFFFLSDLALAIRWQVETMAINLSRLCWNCTPNQHFSVCLLKSFMLEVKTIASKKKENENSSVNNSTSLADATSYLCLAMKRCHISIVNHSTNILRKFVSLYCCFLYSFYSVLVLLQSLVFFYLLFLFCKT